jgi:Zinc-binding dehydrogenase
VKESARRRRRGAGGRGLVSQAGAVLLRETMRVTVLARAACQPGWPGGGRRGRPRPGKVIADLAAAVAPGGECLAAITVPRGQPELAGPVASDPAVNLVAGSREDTEALLDVTKPDGVLVSAASPGGEFPERDATVIFFSVRSDPVQLAHIVGRVEPGHVRLDISDRCPLADARLVHEQSEAGAIRGRVLLTPER